MQLLREFIQSGGTAAARSMMNRFAATLAGLISMCMTTPLPSQERLFAPAPDSPLNVGRGSGDIIFADLNQDRHLDLLTRHLLTRRITVSFGDGKGRFTDAPNGPLALDYSPGAFAFGHINGDADLDMAVAAKDDAKEYVHILSGDGKGGFQEEKGSPITVAAARQTWKPSLHLVDVNEDGKLDIVSANGRRNSIEIHLATDKGYVPGPSVQLDPDHARYNYEIADLDRDGRLDLVIASSTESDDKPTSVVVKRGDGKGNFAHAGSPLLISPAAQIRTLGDVNGDKRLDVVLAHRNQLSILSNRGKGAFALATGSPHEIGAEAFQVAVADFNRDGANDLAAATVNSVTVLLGSGRGFSPAAGSPFAAGPGAYCLSAADINEDGKLDIAASSFEGDGITLLLGQ
jgi:hypothetical protein